MKAGLHGDNVGLFSTQHQEAQEMLYAGLDLSRQRLDVHVLDEDGRTVEVTAVRPDADALRTLARYVLRHGQEVTATIESMTGARFVHDQLELAGWDVEIADAQKVKGLAPLAAKTDKIDAWVLAELGRRDLVPAIWLPDPAVRAERERARFRLYLVRHRTALKNRIHATLMTFGHPVPVSDLFGATGRDLLAGLAIPEPWAGTLATSLAMVDELEVRIDACERDLRTLGAEHRYVRLLCTCPASAGSWPPQSPRRSATSTASARPRSWPGTPACVAVGIIAWIVLGAIAGFITNLIMGGGDAEQPEGGEDQGMKRTPRVGR